NPGAPAAIDNTTEMWYSFVKDKKYIRRRMDRYVLSGMVLQAFATAFLTKAGLIIPSPGQQVGAAILFLIVIGILELRKKR
ncbi:MAG: hypothetical protein Q7R86_01995, partial [bacterium]|nr:hypothetical protein [bacterium]